MRARGSSRRTAGPFPRSVREPGRGAPFVGLERVRDPEIGHRLIQLLVLRGERVLQANFNSDGLILLQAGDVFD